MKNICDNCQLFLPAFGSRGWRQCSIGEDEETGEIFMTRSTDECKCEEEYIEARIELIDK